MLGALFLSALVAFTSVVFAAPLRRQSRGNTGLHPIFSTDNGQNYCVNVTLDEVPDVTFQVDTGGSDTWVVGFTTEGTVQDTVIDLRPRDAVKGQGIASDFDFGNFVVSSQLMLQVEQNDSFSFFPGVLGLGRSNRSAIFAAFDESDTNNQATSFIDTYATDNAHSPFFTLNMLRGNTTNGTIGFGAVDPAFSKVTEQPFQVAQPNLWRIHLDMELGIIVNGRNITLPEESNIGGADNLTVSIDTGFSYTTVRPDLITGIYSLVPTATFNETTGIWRMPCNTELNVTIHFAGVAFPIHPLDMLQGEPFSDGTCLGSFQAQPASLKFTGDIVLGSNFMHNAYVLFSTSGFPDDETKPYIQMLPLTNPDTAHREFIASLDKDGSSQASHSDGTANAANVDFEGERHRQGLDNGARLVTPLYPAVLAILWGLLIWF